jgi:hypothetical protein
MVLKPADRSCGCFEPLRPEAPRINVRRASRALEGQSKPEWHADRPSGHVYLCPGRPPSRG